MWERSWTFVFLRFFGPFWRPGSGLVRLAKPAAFEIVLKGIFCKCVHTATVDQSRRGGVLDRLGRSSQHIHRDRSMKSACAHRPRIPRSMRRACIIAGFFPALLTVRDRTQEAPLDLEFTTVTDTLVPGLEYHHLRSFGSEGWVPLIHRRTGENGGEAMGLCSWLGSKSRSKTVKDDLRRTKTIKDDLTPTASSIVLDRPRSS